MFNNSYWLLASYPRSGNTWCRIFISEILRLKDYKNVNNGALILTNRNLDLNNDLKTGEIISDRKWLDDQLGIPSSDLSSRELDQIRGKMIINKLSANKKSKFHKVHDAYYAKDSSNTLPIVSAKNFKGAIYIVRNPFDLAVSLKHFFSWGQRKSVEFLLDRNAELCGSTKCGDIQCRQFLGTWENHYSSWSTQSDIPTLIIRYEDLIKNPIKNFFQIARFLNLTEDIILVEKAVSKVGFKRISSLEDSLGGFKENLNFKTKFFRSGRVGQAKNVLTKKEIKLIKSTSTNLLQRIYEKEMEFF